MKRIPQNYMKLLREYISFKSDSTDLNCIKECKDNSTWLVDLFKQNGFHTKVIESKNINPIVFASYVVDPDLKTVLIYGHYDIVPANKGDGWKSDPFKVSDRRDRLVARGVVDNKGQTLIHMLTIFELIKEGRLGCNVKFLIEGNEETGSFELPSIISAEKNLLSADEILISDGQLLGDNPTMDVSFRGGANVEIEIKTADTEVHSGMYGGSLPSATYEISKLLSKLVNEDNKVLVPGFYDGCIKVDSEQIKSNTELSNELDLKGMTGSKKVFSQNGNDFYTQTGLCPTIEVTGLCSGYTEEGFKGALPCKATAKIGIRTAPGQSTEDILKKTLNYIKEITPEYVKLSVGSNIDSFDPVYLNTDNEATKNAKSILDDVYGKPTRFCNVGGSLPIIYDLQKVLKSDILFVSLANEDCNMHGAEENFKKDLILKGFEFSERFFEAK